MELRDFEPLARRMNVALAASQCHSRNAVGREPVRVQPAVGDRQLRRAALRLDRRRGNSNAWLVVLQAKRFVIKPALDSNAPTFASHIADICRRTLKSLFNLTHNSL